MEAVTAGFRSRKGRQWQRIMLGRMHFGEKIIRRVSYLVGHHHTYDQIDGLDYQILVEADFLVNLYEDGVTKEAVMHAYNKISARNMENASVQKCLESRNDRWNRRKRF